VFLILEILGCIIIMVSLSLFFKNCIGYITYFFNSRIIFISFESHCNFQSTLSPIKYVVNYKNNAHLRAFLKVKQKMILI